MAHYAQLDENNIVVNVFVGRDDTVEGIDDWETYYATDGFTVKQTSYNTKAGVHYDPETGEPSADQTKALRGNYAGIGFTYDAENDVFVAPQPFDSWVMNETTWTWEAPVDKPSDANDAHDTSLPVKQYEWNEATTSWDYINTWNYNSETETWEKE